MQDVCPKQPASHDRVSSHQMCQFPTERRLILSVFSSWLFRPVGLVVSSTGTYLSLQPNAKILYLFFSWISTDGESCCLVATGLKLWRDLVLHIVILSLSKLASGLLLSAHGSFSHGPTASLKFYQFSVPSLCSICWALPASPMNAGSMIH